MECSLLDTKPKTQIVTAKTARAMVRVLSPNATGTGTACVNVLPAKVVVKKNNARRT